jgi:tetratricopeptide (TPR) repeat protein/tRNA A-37 threonylcarbamoyl transferase component Bud32
VSEGLQQSNVTQDATLPGDDWSADEEESFERGALVGRYIILARLGAGAMGVVHAAYDPELDRKVALKLLRDKRYGERGRARLLREAQALARLSHPNVVAIYDVGIHDDQVWIAMEFVAGWTLGAWLEQRERPWRELLGVMLQAGRGLAAAHEKGLVHRDFKPDNVMIGDDGRVRVMDFGLARAPLSKEHSGPLIEPSIEALIDGTMLSPSGVELTAAGSLMGTPRYMAPELYAGEQADARSDQFSFCVTLWESVYRQRAFEGESLIALSASITEGRLGEPPRRSGVPSWLRRVIERGLRVDPDQRWPGMTPLLAALEPKRTRRRGWVVALTGLLALTAGGYGAQQLRRVHQIEACEAEGRTIREQTWNDAARARIGDTLTATGLDYAEEVRPRVFERVEAYVDEWERGRVQICREAKIDEVLAPDMHELAVECFEEGRNTLDELLVIFAAEADRKLLTRAVSSVASLPRLARCHDRAWLARRVRSPRDLATRDAVRELRRRLDRVGAMQVASKFDEGLREAEVIVDEAEALGWQPLVAEAHFAVGTLLGNVGRHEDAVSVLEQALYEATSSGHDELAASAAEALVFRLGSSLARHEEGLRYADLAKAFITRAGLEGQLLDGKLSSHVGAVRHRQGEYAEALAAYTRAMEIFIRVLGPDHPELARLHANIGVVHYTQGAYDEALEAYARAEALEQEVFGLKHPSLARTWSNIGVVHYVEGRYDQALIYYQRALAVMEAALGPEHVDLAILLNNVGMTHYVRGEDEEALSYYERALEIRERSLGPDHPDVADSLNNLALVHRSLGAPPDEVAGLLERALAILEAALGPDHPQLGGTFANLGINSLERGELEQARAFHERARAIVAAGLGETHPHMANTLVNLGDVALALHELDVARAHFEEAITIYEAAYGTDSHPDAAEALRGLARVHELEGRLADSRVLLEHALEIRERGARPRELADIRFPLARVLWALGEERSRAHELASLARADYEAARRPDDRDAVDAWLAAHPLAP